MTSSIALRSRMPPESVQMLFALALGFAVAGMCGSGYRLATDRLPSFSQLTTGPGAAAFAAIPVGCKPVAGAAQDRKSTRLKSSHTVISYAGFCFEKKKQ